jgi:hypothetical protein
MQKMILEETNCHERDSRVDFNEADHIYAIDNEYGYTSVTQYLHGLFEKFDEDLIINRMVNSKRFNQSAYAGMTVDEIKEQWETNRVTASNAGTKMHEDIEYYYNDQPRENESKEYGFFLDFVKDFSHLKPFRTEWCVFDTKLKLAGSIDMVFFNENTGKYDIYDWKRCKSIEKRSKWGKWSTHPLIESIPDTNYWIYCLQLNVYKTLLELNYGLEIDDLYIVCLHPNQNTYERHKIANLSTEVMGLFKELETKHA